MRRGMEKSDALIVPEKRANKADVLSVALAKEERSAAERVEGSGAKERNAVLQSTARTQSRTAVSQAQARIREAIARNERERLTALLHHVTIDGLRAAFFTLKRNAAAGVDEVTWDEYAHGVEDRLADLHGRVHRGAYRALPSRRKFIPKPDGRLRPLGIAALEDKIVQAALVAILTPVYEAEFLGFSYGFRPGRSQHNALDALAYGIARRRVRWILDADIRSFFDTISHDWLVKLIEHRIGDKRVIRLIQRWLRAGVLEAGHEIATTQGTPQGAVISPLLANIYLHYVFDLWAQQWRRRRSNGDMIVITLRRRHHPRVRAPRRRRTVPGRPASQTGAVRLELAPRKDATDRVRQRRHRRSRPPGRGQARDVRLPRFYALLHEKEERHGLQTRPQDASQTPTNQAEGDQGHSAKAHACINRRTGALARGRAARLLRVLRSPDEQPVPVGIPTTGEGALAPRPATTKPASQSHLGTDADIRRSSLACAACLAPMARATLPRHALNLRAGCGNPASPDPSGGRSAMSVPTATLSLLSQLGIADHPRERPLTGRRGTFHRQGPMAGERQEPAIGTMSP
jgi:hypothetical protein